MKYRMPIRHLVVSCLIAGIAGAQGPSHDGLDWGPLLKITQDERGHLAVTALGPLFEYRKDDAGAAFWALRPLAAYETDVRQTQHDFLWPLGVWRRRGDELQLRLLSYIHNDADLTKPDSAERRCLLPFTVCGIDHNGDHYRSLIPIGGRIRDVAGFDDIRFVLFPAYMQTRKGDTVATHVGFPIYAHVEGPDVHKRRFFPLWGIAEKAGTWTNRFAFWPFLHLGYSRDATTPGRAWLVLPLVGSIHQGEPGQPGYVHRRTLLWPLFSVTQTQAGYSLRLPWPFYRHDENWPKIGDRAMHLWPLYGVTERPGEKTQTLLWPFFRRQIKSNATGTVRRSYLLPFYWSFAAESNAHERISHHRFWPFFSVTRRAGARRIRALDVWPQREASAVERNLAPWWTVYTRTDDENGSRRRALWGLWHYKQDASGTDWALFPLLAHRSETTGNDRTDVLGGLVGHSRHAGHDRIRLLWFLHVNR